MTNKERIREALLGTPGQDYFRQRAFAGWKPVAIISERDIESTVDAAGNAPEDRIPYGLQVAADCASLEENPHEKQVILQVIEGIVQDMRLSQIASDLNRDGHRTRSGRLWSPADVFDLLPRLIEVGPRVFPTQEWAERRTQLLARA